jgi:hypothetical protein
MHVVFTNVAVIPLELPISLSSFFQVIATPRESGLKGSGMFDSIYGQFLLRGDCFILLLSILLINTYETFSAVILTKSIFFSIHEVWIAHPKIPNI